MGREVGSGLFADPGGTGHDGNFVRMDIDGDPGDELRSPGWGWERIKPVLTWVLASLPAVWLVLRITGIGSGTPLETAMVFTPFVALGSLAVVGLVAWWRAVPAAVVAGFGTIGLGLVVLPMFQASSQPGAGADGPELTVMTINARYGEAEAEEIVALVRDHDVDLVGVQELTPDLVQRLSDAGLDSLLPHSDLAPDPGAAGMAVYANRPFEPVDLKIGGEISSPTARFELGGAVPLEVTVVHPLPPLGQWRADWLDTLGTIPSTEVGLTRVLLGDFNATLDQPSMRAVLDRGYLDAADLVGRGWVPTWGPAGTSVLAIDHVLVDRTVLVQSVSVHDVTGSDHRAVIASIRIPRR